MGTVEGRARGHIQREEAARSLKTQRSCEVTAVASVQGVGGRHSRVSAAGLYIHRKPG